MNENNQNKEGGNSPKKNYTALLITLIFTLFIVGAMHSWWQQSRSEQIPYSEFNQMLKDHEIESVVVSGSKITITPKKDSKKYGKGETLAQGGLMGVEYYTVPMYDPDLQTKLDKYGVETYEQASQDPTMSIIAILVEWVLPIVVMLFIFNFMMRRMGGGGGLMNVGKNNARVYVQKSTGVTFADVAGEDEAKESLTEIVDFLHNPGKYTTIGAKLP
ncbi:MAG: ATP-dependent metallopeptidase FtsH/Yme1/Tma family protein, partial [Clostridium sp.]|nr:ATP-dependent metallopeptidase FtsH/Yme1/Tma family protein [Clostridium sp.]